MGFVSQATPAKRDSGLGGGPPGLDDREQDFAQGWLRALLKANIDDSEAAALTEDLADVQQTIRWRPVDEAMHDLLSDDLAWGWSRGLESGMAQVPTPSFAKAASDQLLNLIGGIEESSHLVTQRVQAQISRISLNAQSQTVKGVRTVVRKMVDGDYSLEQAKRVLVQNVHLGLSERYQTAVHNRLTSLQDELRAAHPNWKPSTVEARARTQAAEYATRLRRSQAEMVARTEVMRSVNGGRVEAWRQAQDNGELGSGAMKEWIIHGAIDVCESFGGQRVPIRETFELGDPPLHPRCRCEVSLVVEGF